MQTGKLQIAVGEDIVTLEELDIVHRIGGGKTRHDGENGQHSREKKLGEHVGC
jgi:hypothetical protein